MNFGHIFSNMFGGQPQGIVEGDEQPAHPSMGMPAAPMPWHPSKGQTIAGIIGDTLASVSGGQPVFTQNLMHARQLQQQAAAEEAQWGRHHATEQADRMQAAQFAVDHRAPTAFEDNAGNRWVTDPTTGENRMVFVDRAPKQYMQDGMLVSVPNPFAAGGPAPTPPAAHPPTIDESLWNTGQPVGGQTPPASGNFRRR